MADISYISTGGTTYNIADLVARSGMGGDCITVSTTFPDLPMTIYDENITSDMVVVSATFDLPENLPKSLSWSTGNGSLTIARNGDGSILAPVAGVFILAKTE